MFMGGWGALLGTERIGAAAFPLGSGETERQLELMHRVGSTVLICTLDVCPPHARDGRGSRLRHGGPAAATADTNVSFLIEILPPNKRLDDQRPKCRPSPVG